MNAADLGAFLGNMATDSMTSMEEERQDFQDRMAQQSAIGDASAMRVMDRLNKRRQPQGPQYSEDVKGIANMLTQFPKMIPVVKAVIFKLTAEMDKAFAATANQYLNDPVVQEILKQQQTAAAASAGGA